jgi:CRISP-associated protein Cas1
MQLHSYEDRRGVQLGKAFVTGKLKNSANNLKYYAKYRKGADRAAYDFVYRKVDKIEDLLREVVKIEGSCVDELRGSLLNAEGRGAALYWEGIKRLVPDFPYDLDLLPAVLLVQEENRTARGNRGAR